MQLIMITDANILHLNDTNIIIIIFICSPSELEKVFYFSHNRFVFEMKVKIFC